MVNCSSCDVSSLDFSNVLAFDLADTLFTVDRRPGDFDLYMIDLTTGAATLIGPTGLARLAALAFEPLVGIPGPQGE